VSGLRPTQVARAPNVRSLPCRCMPTPLPAADGCGAVPEKPGYRYPVLQGVRVTLALTP
jgi:hypothetical protein